MIAPPDDFRRTYVNLMYSAASQPYYPWDWWPIEGFTKPRHETRDPNANATRVIVFGYDPQTGARSVDDILEMDGPDRTLEDFRWYLDPAVFAGRVEYYIERVESCGGIRP